MKRIKDRPLTEDNVNDIICCPGGPEIKGKNLEGRIERTIAWRMKMIQLGMSGFVSYQDGLARGFIEYMPAETAPFPIQAPGACVLMCYHWKTEKEDNEEEHLAQEKRLIHLVVEEIKDEFAGIATLGWDNPTHFPISLLEEIGFQELERIDYLALMWLPFEEEVTLPEIPPSQFEPQDLSSQGLLAVESASSSRCPYSVHEAARLTRVIRNLPREYRTQIRHFSHLIDTHQDALAYSLSPWDWGWTFFNGKEITLFKLKSDQLNQLLRDEINNLKA